ncbi:putative LRR receptor-like serine/threonine-protein kinase [Capsicum annuum]|uniref:LRR receptor-like serine/threonine-protein kinase n=1 Tax=Capsicum annuum TaxID=4072 RepID=A0A2G2Y7U0_CAPAN|nr:putative LRR receptor-like serine/threonine-protein kinase [Capsicum annuum]
MVAENNLSSLFLQILLSQLDNNNFKGSQIPDSYGNMSRLLKLSLRNCSLQGPVPNLGNIPNLTYIDLSLNQLSGSIPSDKLSDNMTTIDLSYNNLNGTIPSNFSRLPHLQKLDLRNNKLLNISGTLVVPQNVTVRLQGNPFCSSSILINFCGAYNGDAGGTLQLANNTDCPPLACPPPYEYALPYPTCFCALPLLIGYRLKSPGFLDFRPYVDKFEWYIMFGLKLNISQLHLNTFALEAGPRVRMYLRIFPIYVDNNSSHLFNKSEVLRLRSMFTGWLIPDNDLFGPYELLNFTLLADYREFIPPPSSSGVSKGALAGIILGVVAGAVTISAFVSLFILRLHMKKHHRAISKRSLCEYTTVTDLEVGTLSHPFFFYF